jgi:protein-S-isoprenylcysteine O-methyltransferase Ste14
MAYTKEGEVKDLREKIEKGNLTPKEGIKILKERELIEPESWKGYYNIWYVVWVILCFPLSAFQLLTIKFPMALIYSAIVFFILAICVEAYVSVYWRMKRGGLYSEGKTVLLLKKGPYRIVRHPSNIIWTVMFIAPTIAISNHVPFTIFSLMGNIGLIVFHYWASVVEEELNVKKWGDEYRQYMKEVPRFNFIKGLWNLRKGKNERKRGI